MSENKKYPSLRKDLEVVSYESEGVKMAAIIDTLGFIEEPLPIPFETYAFLTTFDGTITREDLENTIKNSPGSDAVNVEEIIKTLEIFTTSLFFETDEYWVRKKDIEENFLNKTDRPYVCAGNSYPEDVNQLNEYLDKILQSDSTEKVDSANAIIVPHIDFKLGKLAHDVYAKAYSAIADTDAELFVIFGTAHQYSSDFFMFTDKNYSSPIGSVETDLDVLAELQASLGKNLTVDNIAHRYEHSIEYQVVLLQRAFKHRKYKVLPILVGSMHQFVVNGTTPISLDRFNVFIEEIKRVTADRKVMFISSVDFAHVGRKFGDDFDASSKFEDIETFDSSLIFSLEKGDAEAFFETVIDNGDEMKICGLAPIYSMVKVLGDDVKGKFLAHGLWDEQETKSAVSFASMVFEK